MILLVLICRLLTMKRQPPNTQTTPFKKSKRSTDSPFDVLGLVPEDCLSIIGDFLTRPPFLSNPYRRPLSHSHSNRTYEELDSLTQKLADARQRRRRRKGWLTPHGLRPLLSFRTVSKKLELSCLSWVSKVDVSGGFRSGNWPRDPRMYLDFLSKFHNLQSIAFDFDMPIVPSIWNLFETPVDLNLAWGNFLGSMVRLRKLHLVAGLAGNSYHSARTYDSTGLLDHKKRSFCNSQMRKHILAAEVKAFSQNSKLNDIPSFFHRIESITFDRRGSHGFGFLIHFPNLRNLHASASDPRSARRECENFSLKGKSIFSYFSNLEKLCIPKNAMGFHPGLANHLKKLKKLDISQYSICKGERSSHATSFLEPLESNFPLLEELIMDDAMCSVEYHLVYEEMKKMVHLPSLKSISIRDTAEDVNFFTNPTYGDFFQNASNLTSLNVRTSSIERTWSAEQLQKCSSLKILKLTVGPTDWERQLEVLISALPYLSKLETFHIWFREGYVMSTVDYERSKASMLFETLSKKSKVTHVSLSTDSQHLANLAKELLISENRLIDCKFHVMEKPDARTTTGLGPPPLDLTLPLVWI